MSLHSNIFPCSEAPRCGINDLSHRPCRVAAAVLIIALIVAAAIIWWLEVHQIMHAKSRATTLATFHAHAVERRFDPTLMVIMMFGTDIQAFPHLKGWIPWKIASCW